MSDELDPEVLADLRLRASSMYDTSRTRPVDVNQLWSPPTFVAQWRCRYPTCRVLVDVDADTVEQLAKFNEELAARRARGDLDKTHPIETHEVVICEAHRRLFESKRAERLRERSNELGDAIRQLKASKDPRGERALLEVLQRKHHPDIDGLLQQLTEKLGGNKRKGAGV